MTELVDDNNSQVPIGETENTRTYDPSNPIYDEYLTLCACNSSEHQMIWRVDREPIDGDVTVYCDIHLIPHRWYERIWYAIKYIFGYTSKYGAFEEFIFRKCDLPKFEKMIEALKESCV